jgi:kumamolisin
METLSSSLSKTAPLGTFQSGFIGLPKDPRPTPDGVRKKEQPMSPNNFETSSQRVSLSHSERNAPAGARMIGPVDSTELINVSVILRRMQPLDLKQMGGRTLSRQEFAAKHGADPAAADMVRKFAAAQDLTVDESASSLIRRTMVLRGTAAAMQKAFGVELNQYEFQDRDGLTQRFRGRQGALMVPSDLANNVEAVMGLDNRPQAEAHFRKIGAAGSHAAAPRNAANLSYTPVQVAQLYNFPADATGAGQTIGILELGGGYQTSDLQQYFSNQRLNPPKIVTVSVDGATSSPGDPNGPDGEVMLDIEVAASVAPGATIAMYFAPNTDQGFLDAITTAIHDTTNNPSVLSISWGSAESNWTQQAMQAMDQAFQSAAALGITVTVASGDDGSSDGVSDNANHVDFPSSSPHVLACGGTHMATSNGSLTGETVWNDMPQGGATGGGVSAVFALPDYQTSSNVPPPSNNIGGRGVPDVSGDADPQSGYQIQVDGESGVFGGTSAVAPLWAGLVARMNQKLGQPVGFLNPKLYSTGVAQAMRDITNGNNGAFTARPGWDACTGLGSPNGTPLAAILSQPSSQTQSGQKAGQPG